MGGCNAKRCGVGIDELSHLPDHIKEKVYNHPCYSQEAHHFYARMHVAVAPACNIQCNYCNRKYDCANESRPGVVSELLTPEEAVKKVLAVAMEIPQMTVVGIAGPGDPLANPERTFRTFELIKEKAPDIKLCLSTNGLKLTEYIGKIKELGVDHVTITINAVSPEVASRIYSWIFFNHRRYRGLEAAKILLEKQYEGLKACVENGILVKVNTVFIPEINGEEIEELSKKVRKMGAFLHNIMPYVESDGTVYQRMGIKPPTPSQLKEIQEKCESHMSLMRHCRQCRADAVGLLGEDRGQEFTKDKIAKLEINYNPEFRKSIHEEIEKEDWESLFFRIYIDVERHLGKEKPEFITHFPKRLSAYAKVRDGYAERFELYIRGIEIANGWTEEEDKEEIKRRMEEYKSGREIPIDEELLKAYEDFPPCAGCSIGLERLFMVYMGLESLEGLSF